MMKLPNLSTFKYSTLFLTLTVALGYYLLGVFSFSIFSQDSIVTLAAFLPEGLSLAAVLLFGYRVLPGIFLGQLILAIYSGLPGEVSLIISVINTLEAALGNYLFYRFKLDASLSRVRDIGGLLLLIFFVLQPFSSLLGNTALLLTQHVDLKEFWNNVILWWFGNVIGQILLTPMLLIFYATRHKLSLSTLAILTLITPLLVYFLIVTSGISNVLLVLLFTLSYTLYLSHAKLIYGIYASCIIALTALIITHNNIGVFAIHSPLDNLINLNFFILVHIIASLYTGVLFFEKETMISTLKSLAYYDPLTGLPNRHLLHDELLVAIHHAEIYHYNSAICFIDIDDFKQINDTLGHDIGDRLLKKIAQIFREHLKDEESVLRIAGDEFLLILTKCSSKEEIRERLKPILDAIIHLRTIDTHTVNVSCSIGVACCPEDGNTPKKLYTASDEAMYRAKKNGKNQIACFSDMTC